MARVEQAVRAYEGRCAPSQNSSDGSGADLYQKAAYVYVKISDSSSHEDRCNVICVEVIVSSRTCPTSSLIKRHPRRMKTAATVLEYPTMRSGRPAQTCSAESQLHHAPVVLRVSLRPPCGNRRR
eukprot:2935097-Pleurochrysis_carterae.AAC.1